MRQQPYCTRTPTTHQLNGGEETEWWSQSVYGDDYEAMMVRWPMGKFWVFTTESQDLGLMSQDGAFYSIVSPSLHWGVRTHTDSMVSNLVSQEVSHPGTDQAQPCLSSVGNQTWAACRWYHFLISPSLLDSVPLRQMGDVCTDEWECGDRSSGCLYSTHLQAIQNAPKYLKKRDRFFFKLTSSTF